MRFNHWARLFFSSSVLFSEIDRLTESMKNLSENITNIVNDFEQSLKHETSEMKHLLNEEVLKLRETHQDEITSLRLEHQQNSTVLTQEFKQELATETETLKRQMDDLGVRSTILRNLTNSLSTNYNVLYAAQVRTYALNFCNLIVNEGPAEFFHKIKFHRKSHLPINVPHFLQYTR